MKHLIKLLLVFLIALLAGCMPVKRAPQDNRVTITGSGNLVSQEVNLSGFDQIEAGLSFDLSIHPGTEFNVVLISDDNFVEYLQVEQSGKTISFGFKPDYAYDLAGVTLQAEVTMPEVAGLLLSGSSHVMLNGFTSMESFTAELSGSSSLGGKLEADDSNFSLSGSTYVELAGSGKNIKIDASGSSVIDLSDYHVEDAALHVSGVSTAIVNVKGRLDADTSQNSFVYYLGHPALGDIITDENASVEQK